MAALVSESAVLVSESAVDLKNKHPVKPIALEAWVPPVLSTSFDHLALENGSVTTWLKAPVVDVVGKWSV